MTLILVECLGSRVSSPRCGVGVESFGGENENVPFVDHN